MILIILKTLAAILEWAGGFGIKVKVGDFFWTNKKFKAELELDLKFDIFFWIIWCGILTNLAILS